MRWFGFAAVAVAFAPAVLGSFAPVPALAQDAPTQTLRIALREDADMLDPSLARSLVGRTVFASLCDKLFDINDKLDIVPQLATGFEWADPEHLIIHLRAGVVFHDGTKMDAAAVKYSLERHLTMPGSSRRGEISAMDHVEVVDPLTVKVVLKSANAPFVSQLTDRAGMIVSPTAAEAEGKDFALHPVCAGPFKFVERVPQDRIVLDRFAEYWNAGAIHFARVVFQPIVDPSVRLANLQAGSTDLVEYILPTDVDTIRKNSKLRLLTSYNLGYWSVTFNVGKSARSETAMGRDVRVRRAFELSIDREALIQVVYAGMYDATAQAVPKESPFFDPTVQPVPRDVAAAKLLLAQAGVKTPLTVTMMLANNADTRQVGEVLQSMVAEAGFNLKLQATEFASSLDAADRGDFETYFGGWSGRPDPDGNLWNFLHSGAPLNYSGYKSPVVDAALEQARAVSDTAGRRAAYAKVAEQTEADLPRMTLYVPKNLVGMSAKLTGVSAIPDGLIRPQNVRLSP